MTSGQVLFYFHGNLGKDVCLDIAKSTRDVLKMAPLPVDQLPSPCAVTLKPGKTLCYEALLKDTKNDNSCSMVIYQGPPGTTKET